MNAEEANCESYQGQFTSCLPTSKHQELAGVGGSRTHRRHRRAPTNGFEVREAHQDLSTPTRHSVELQRRNLRGTLNHQRIGLSGRSAYRADSRCFLITALGTAPTTWSIGFPPLNTSKVGMLLMPYFIAVSGLVSTSTLVNFTFPSYS